MQPRRSVSTHIRRAPRTAAYTDAFLMKVMRGDVEDVAAEVRDGQDVNALHSVGPGDPGTFAPPAPVALPPPAPVCVYTL